MFSLSGYMNQGACVFSVWLYESGSMCFLTVELFVNYCKNALVKSILSSHHVKCYYIIKELTFS